VVTIIIRIDFHPNTFGSTPDRRIVGVCALTTPNALTETGYRVIRESGIREVIKGAKLVRGPQDQPVMTHIGWM